MLLSNQMFDRIVGLSNPNAADPQRQAAVLPAGCRRVSERRQATRLAYGHRTQICRDGGKKAGVWDTVMLQDISVKGIGYMSNDPMEIGETFVLKLTDKDGQTIRIRCKVHRSERGGFGNTAHLLGATFEQVIQQQILRVNDDDEKEAPVWQGDSRAELEPVLASTGAGGAKASGSTVASLAFSLLRAFDPRRATLPWARKSDDFSSVG